MGIYYENIDLVYIHDGIHSISGAIEINKKGEIYIRKVKDIRKLYNHLYTDGIYWYSSHTNEKIDEVFDFRIAIIYEISKLKNKIEKGEYFYSPFSILLKGGGSVAVDKNLRELASAILKANGIDHDKWLSEKYTELIVENASMLKAGIQEKKEVKTDMQSDVDLNIKDQQRNQGVNQRPWEQTS